MSRRSGRRFADKDTQESTAVPGHGMDRIRFSSTGNGCRMGKRARRQVMPRHAGYIPHGVIPAVLLPFHDDLSIDEKHFRKHLRDVGATEGISALTINAHSTEVASCTFD